MTSQTQTPAFNPVNPGRGARGPHSPAFIRSTVKFPECGDGVTDVTDIWIDYFNRMYRTGRTLEVQDGDYRVSRQLPDINDFRLVRSPSSVLTLTRKTGMRIRLTGENSAIIGGEIRNQTMRRYYISSATQAGGAGTPITFQTCDDAGTALAVDFEASETVLFQNLVNSAGSLNNTGLAVASVADDGLSFTIAGTGITLTATTYPYDPLDGVGRSIYPCVYRSRTTSADDCLIQFAASIGANRVINGLVRGVTLRWASAGTILCYNAVDSKIEKNTLIEGCADGIFLAGSQGASCINVDVMDNEIIRPGDDGIACIGYLESAARVSGCRIMRNRVREQWFGGRGYTFAGTRGIRAAGNEAYDVYGAALIVVRDSSSGTTGNEDLTFKDFTFKHCGRDSATTPAGWGNTSYGAIRIGGEGTDQENFNRQIRIHNGVVMNSRYRGLDGASKVKEPHLRSVRFIECADHAWVDVLGENGIYEDIYAEACRYMLFYDTASLDSGRNRILRPRMKDVGRQGRLWMESAVVTAADGGTLTLTVNSGVTHGLSGGSVIRVYGVGTGYTSASSTATEQRKDFAINGTYTLTSVDGQDLIITSTGLSATDHASCLTPDQPCPVAYVSLVTSAAGADGIYVDAADIGGFLHIDEPEFIGTPHVLDRWIDTGTGDNSKIMVTRPRNKINAEGLTDPAVYLRSAPQVAYDEATATGVTIAAEDFLKVDMYRSGQNSSQTDTSPTAAAICAGLPDIHVGRRFRFNYNNLHATNSITFAGGSGVTLSGTGVTAALTAVEWLGSVSDPTPGSEAITITRKRAYTIAS